MKKGIIPRTVTRTLGKTAAYSAIASAIFFATQAQAQLLNNITIGNPKALGMGNAVTADPPGIDSIHFNPAGLAKIKGRQRQVKVLVAHMEMESKFGYPERPGDDVKQTYWNMSRECQQQNLSLNDCWGVDPVGNSSSQTGDPALMLPFVGLVELPILAVPTGGFAFEDVSNGWTFGTAVYSPEGVGYTRGANDPGAYQGMAVGITRLTYFSPTIGIPITDTLSIGAGVTFSYQGLGLETKFRAPLMTTKFIETVNNTGVLQLDVLKPYDTVGTLEIEVEDMMSVGFNFGILWEATEWLALGFSYRSESRSNMTGDFKMTNSDSFLHTTAALSEPPLGALMTGLMPIIGGAPFHSQRVESGKVELEHIMPQTINFGVSVKVLPNLKVNTDLRWIEYSTWDVLNFKYDRNVDFLTLASVVNFVSGVGDWADPNAMRIRREYKDSWSAAFGVEYTLNDNMVLRFGFEPRTSSIPSDKTDLLFPITDANLYTAGFGWQFNKTTRIEGAFGYMYSDSKTPAGKSSNANSNLEGDVVYNPYFATDFANETTAYLFALSMDQKF